jgi:hypothetical protein
MEYELEPRYDTRKSFYGKAIVREENGKTILRSYSTDVAYIQNGKATVNGMYSNTTLRHIKEFLLQHGFTADNWAQIEKDYSPSEEQIKQDREEEEKKANSMFKTVGLVAAMGEIFCNNKKDKNDWKLRMLKAGLENKGLSVPEDWDTLTEQEKEKRLDGVISIAKSE